MTTVPLTRGPTKTYLGDGLFAEIENRVLKLTAEDGLHAHETVYLERQVWNALADYMKTHAKSLL